ncbi:chemotaxis protein CheW [Novosphingobium mangrovi (ex Huang et al. 2023)]|uniref:Chemotaxis protein CheW n=1 Tax=Novosphingobium mangrovi (ex Huang et al. 2023) TaxID=2976432 RepID=A0ABT2I497_9SPHN|nr:chemotaxis protein CheW [Novosphingobium mangrovi (ex Huang et al. 2023)]MCT2399622.1 chemotaxis protein CheW [Novosphingobium mangrovi (ex Huang et al. 2023)]
MNDLLLIVVAAGEKVALRSCDVQSVIELEMLAPVPCAPSHVAGLSALRSRVLTVIDCQSALALGQAINREAGAPAVVVDHEGHAYALLLDGIESVTKARSDPGPVRTRMGGNWAAMSHGMVETDEGPLLLVDVAALIAGPQEVRAA